MNNSKKYLNSRNIKILFLFLLIIAPWSLKTNSDLIEVKKINDTNIGYYQINTCSMTLQEVFAKNIGNSDVIYKFDNYSNIRCFGKVNGLDKVDGKYHVGIGTNLLINLILQSLFWLTLFSFLPQDKALKLNNKFLSIGLVAFLNIIHFFGENNFYNLSSRNVDYEISLTNFFLLSLILIFILIGYFTFSIAEKVSSNLLTFFPFLFLINGTFNYSNINYILIIFSIYGIQNVLENKNLRKFNYTYVIFLIFWLFLQENNNYLFDVDKLRGFSNSSDSYLSNIYWFINFLLLINGVYFLLKKRKTKEIQNKFIMNFALSGALVLISGFIGSLSNVFNFLSYYYLGLNKRGMSQITSIEGNTWRGISPSAESIGEFYGIVIFLSLVYMIKNKNKNNILITLLLVINLIGLIRANNIAAVLTLFVIVILYLMNLKLDLSFRTVTLVGIVIIPLLITVGLNLNNMSYESASRSLILDGLRYSNLYENELDRNLKVERFFIEEDDLETIFLYPNNREKISSSFEFIINGYNNNNIKFLPNYVSILSIFSLLINRSEKWGIFLSKYNPDFSEFLVGTGPLQFNKYFFGHNRNNIEGLVLPHSSLLDILIFFGITGLLTFMFFLLRNLIKNNNFKNPNWYILLFLSINILKSDSLLYIPPLIMFLIFYNQLNFQADLEENK